MQGACIVSYDIFDDWRRHLVAGECARRGFRVQQSMWVVPIRSTIDYRLLTSRIHNAIKSNDRVLIHVPCRRCLRRVVHLPRSDATFQTGDHLLL